MKTPRALAATLTAAVLLAGCTPAAPVPTVTVTAPPPAAVTTAPAEAAVCDYSAMDSDGAFVLAVQAWGVVKQTAGMSIHKRAIGALTEEVGMAVDAEKTAPCVGHDELQAFAAAVEELKIAVGLGSGDTAEVAEYVKVATAGNAWFDAVGYTSKRFA